MGARGIFLGIFEWSKQVRTPRHLGPAPETSSSGGLNSHCQEPTIREITYTRMDHDQDTDCHRLPPSRHTRRKVDEDTEHPTELQIFRKCLQARMWSMLEVALNLVAIGERWTQHKRGTG